MLLLRTLIFFFETNVQIILSSFLVTFLSKLFVYSSKFKPQMLKPRQGQKRNSESPINRVARLLLLSFTREDLHKISQMKILWKCLNLIWSFFRFSLFSCFWSDLLLLLETMGFCLCPLDTPARLWTTSFFRHKLIMIF